MQDVYYQIQAIDKRFSLMHVWEKCNRWVSDHLSMLHDMGEYENLVVTLYKVVSTRDMIIDTSGDIITITGEDTDQLPDLDQRTLRYLADYIRLMRCHPINTTIITEHDNVLTYHHQLIHPYPYTEELFDRRLLETCIPRTSLTYSLEDELQRCKKKQEYASMFDDKFSKLISYSAILDKIIYYQDLKVINLVFKEPCKMEGCIMVDDCNACYKNASLDMFFSLVAYFWLGEPVNRNRTLIETKNYSAPFIDI